MNNINFRAELSNEQSTIKTGLSLIHFEEENVHFVYCPALDITGYGYDKNEAKGSFTQSLKMYFEYTTDKKTLFKDLEAHGWVVKNKRKIKAPDFNFLFEHNEQLKKIVNEKAFSKYDELIQLPDCVYA